MLLVSIHDVTPALEPQVYQLWELCERHGITPALLIVPNWHGAWPLELHPRFISWIRARAQQGAELVLHGERHDEAGFTRRIGDRWKAWGKTSGEGEFLSLGEPEACARIERGRTLLAKLGVPVIGFVPPAWLAPRSADRAIAQAGFAFTEDAREVRVFPSGRRISSPVVRWSSRTPTRAWGSVAVAAARWRLQGNAPWPRLALHPQDLNHPATSRSLERALQLWTGRHRTGRYADLCAALNS